MVMDLIADILVPMNKHVVNYSTEVYHLFLLNFSSEQLLFTAYIASMD
jgi:hypothetical protein